MRRILGLLAVAIAIALATTLTAPSFAAQPTVTNDDQPVDQPTDPVVSYTITAGQVDYDTTGR